MTAPVHPLAGTVGHPSTPLAAPLRIVLVTPGFSASDGDDCIPALRTLVRSLSRRHRVNVLALRYPGRAGVYELDGARVTALGGGLPTRWSRPLLLARAAMWLRGLVRRGEVDLIHALWADEPGFLAVSIERWTGIPALVSLMGGELARLERPDYGLGLHRVPRWLVAQTLRHARHLTVGSPWLLERATDRLVREGSSVVPACTPLGIDTSLFGPAPLPGEIHPLTEGEPKILCVGSLSPVKGHANLLAAFARALPAMPRAVLHLLGDGPLRGELEGLAASLAIAQQVRFHGALPHSRLPACYRAADFCVLASYWESQSMVALEAAATGRVTVGSRVGLLPELAPAELLAPPGEVDPLARVLERIGADRGSWSRLGAEAKARAIPSCSIDAASDRFEEAWATALAPRGEGAGARR